MTMALALCALAGLLAVAQAALYRRLQDAQRLLAVRESEHHAARDRLLESENRLRTIIESEPECVKLQAADGTVMEVNPAGLALVDARHPEQLVGKSIYNLVAPECRANYRDQMERVFAGESTVFEFKSLSVLGRESWMETHAAPLRDARGQIIAFLGVTRDMTDRKMAEEQARKHQLELARVARLSSMGEMATGIAHELNQPLAAIANFARGCVRRLRSGNADTDKLVATLEEVCTQADRAAEVIRHVRDFTRKAELRPCRHDINAIVRTVGRFTEAEVCHHGARLAMDLAPALPEVEVDGIMIEQVLCNLVRNAAEAMDDSGSPDPVITVRTSLGPDGQVEVATCDRGPGVPADVAAHIFEPFFTTKTEGIGIGLAISRSIVEAHGGSIEVGAAPEGGAVFRVRLPAVPARLAAAQAPVHLEEVLA